uniref:Uncharacterized protein n=1 Tax=Serinus canaria TaxID=9135 RepID=A0A8C9NAX2_SERCA
MSLGAGASRPAPAADTPALAFPLGGLGWTAETAALADTLPWRLKQASGNRVGALCTYSGFLGLPSLSVLRNRSVPVSSLAQKPKPWQSHRLSPPSPAHSAASGTIFQIVLQNSFLASVCLSGESRAVPRRGVAGAPRATGCRPPGEPGRRSACPRWPFRPALREGPGVSSPFLLRRIGLTVWDERYLRLGKHPSPSSERSVVRSPLTLICIKCWRS